MENNGNHNAIYTLGIWTARAGREAEFIEEWTSFANWTSKNMPGCEKAFLLRDVKNDSRFISFGPWNNEKSIQDWRNSNEFKQFAAKVKELCDDFQPNTLTVASASI